MKKKIKVKSVTQVLPFQDIQFVDKLNEDVEHVDPEKLYQISMDNQVVNIKFLNEFKLKQEGNASSNVNEVIRAILDFLIYKKITSRKAKMLTGKQK